MKTTRSIAIALLASMIVLPIVAEATDKPSRAERRAERAAIREHPGGLIQAEWLHHRAIKDDQGRDLGKIQEVWFDPKSGRVKEVVVSVGGFLGIGDKHRVLPYEDLRVQWEKQDLVVRADEAALKRARVYETQPAASPRLDRKR